MKLFLWLLQIVAEMVRNLCHGLRILYLEVGWEYFIW